MAVGGVCVWGGITGVAARLRLRGFSAFPPRLAARAATRLRQADRLPRIQHAAARRLSRGCERARARATVCGDVCVRPRGTAQRVMQWQVEREWRGMGAAVGGARTGADVDKQKQVRARLLVELLRRVHKHVVAPHLCSAESRTRRVPIEGAIGCRRPEGPSLAHPLHASDRRRQRSQLRAHLPQPHWARPCHSCAGTRHLPQPHW